MSLVRALIGAVGLLSWSTTQWLAAPLPQAKAPAPDVTFKGHKSPQMYAVVFSPDGKVLATANGDKTIKLWDVSTGKCLQTLRGHFELWRKEKKEGVAYSLAFSPDSKTLASGGDDGIRLWDVTTGKLLGLLSEPPKYASRILVYSSDGKTIASAAGNNVWVWDVAKRTVSRSFELYDAPRGHLSYDPAGKLLVAARDFTTKRGGMVLHTNTFSHFDGATGKSVMTFKGHKQPVINILISRDGKKMFSTAFDQTVRVWDRATGKNLKTFEHPNAEPGGMALSPDGKSLAVGYARLKIEKTATRADAFYVRVYDLASGKVRATKPGGRLITGGLAWSPDSKRLITGVAGAPDLLLVSLTSIPEAE